MTDRSLITLDFHGATLVVRRGETPETTMVAMKPVVEGMGLAWQPQHRKMVEHPVLKTCVTNSMMQMLGDAQAREWAFMPLNRLNFWLATIQPNKVPDPATRARVIEYQAECADALFHHFFGKAVAAGPHLTAGQFGGIAKAVVSKALAEHKAEVMRAVMEIVRQEVAAFSTPSAQHKTAVEFQPALAIAERYEVPQKGRGALVRRLSNALDKFCRREGLAMRAEAHTDRRLFHVDAIDKFLLAGGLEIIRQHTDRLAGRERMSFGAPRRGLRVVGEGEAG